MRIGGALALSGMERGRLTTLLTRQQVPFAVSSSGSGIKHRQFTVSEALSLRLMVMVGADRDFSGLGPSDSARLIANALGKAREKYGAGIEAVITNPSVWIGGMEFRGETRCGEVETWFEWFAGPLHSIDTWCGNCLEPWNETYRRASPVRILALVNLTAAAEYVIERAQDMEIPINE